MLLLCYEKEIRNRKGAGLFVEQRGSSSLSCELQCSVVGIISSLLFTFLRDFGDRPSGSVLAFGYIPQEGAAFAGGSWTTTGSISFLVVLLHVWKKALLSPWFCLKLCNYSHIEQLLSRALGLYTFQVYFVVVTQWFRFMIEQHLFKCVFPIQHAKDSIACGSQPDMHAPGDNNKQSVGLNFSSGQRLIVVVGQQKITTVYSIWRSKLYVKNSSKLLKYFEIQQYLTLLSLEGRRLSALNQSCRLVMQRYRSSDNFLVSVEGLSLKQYVFNCIEKLFVQQCI